MIVKNVFAALVLCACVGYVIAAVTMWPTSRAGTLAVTAAQAGAVALLYLVILVNNNAPTLARMGTRLRRMTRRQIRLFFAQLTLWSVAISALLYSVITQL